MRRGWRALMGRLGTGLVHLVWVLLVPGFLSGCVNSGMRLDEKAARLGYTRALVTGTRFAHVVYQKPGLRSAQALHIYLEGDGSPWASRQRISLDPTPRNPLMFQLMGLDGNEAVYVGRPCYHGLASTPPCAPRLWTSGRYSEEVVASMAAVVNALLEARKNPTPFFFGHSGGGTLAMLLAERFSETGGVVTLAGNLDPDAWASHHGYSPLVGSLNPARRAPLGPHIKQLHLVGRHDEVVPPPLVRRVVTAHPSAYVMVLEGFNHRCCWEKVWPAVLKWLKESVACAWSLRNTCQASKFHPGAAYERVAGNVTVSQQGIVGQKG